VNLGTDHYVTVPLSYVGDKTEARRTLEVETPKAEVREKAEGIDIVLHFNVMSLERCLSLWYNCCVAEKK
jgi:hypothetical protein